MHSSAAKKIGPRAIAAVLLPVVFYAFLVGNGWLGANFGLHWDEHLFVEFADAFHFHGQWIPTMFLYPSFCSWMVLAASVPFRWFHPDLAGMPLTQSMDFTIFCRDIFVAVASLGVVWVYLLTLKLTRRLWIASLAGLMFCGSFEFSYHSRWAVSDLIASQFAILSTLLLFTDLSLARRIGWAAFVAGIAAGTKYTAGIVMLNVVILLATSLQPWKGVERARPFLRQLSLAGLIFGLAFFLTTPGCIIHAKTFIHGIEFQRSVYASGHQGYTVTPGWDHFSRIMTYYALVLFSPLPAGSALVCLLALAGAAHAARGREWNIFGLFLVMLVYTVYVSSFKVMIVRNLSYVLPYFTVLAAYGLFALHRRFAGRSLVFLADAVVVGFAAAALLAVTRDSLTIYRKEAIDMKAELSAYLNANPEGSFIFSSGIRKLLPMQPATTGSLGDPKARLVFVSGEIDDETIPSNHYGAYETIAGPRDVNFDYYPNWSGQRRIVIMQAGLANRKMLDELGVK